MLSPTSAYRLGVALSVASSVLLAVVSLGVGVIGADGDPANLWYLGVLAVGVVGAAGSRFRAPGLARTLAAMAGAQAAVGAVAIVGGLGRPYSGALELAGLTALFGALFAGAAWLFRRASGPGPPG